MKLLAVTGVLVALTEVAQAGSWTFSWTCSGACAPEQLDVRGTEVGFPDKGSCVRARNEKLLEINATGSAGSTTECVDSEPGQPGSRGAIGRAARAARFSRMYVALDGGRGYKASYDDDRVERGASQLGVQVEAIFGRDELGVGVEVGLRRDAGTSPMAGLPVDPMFLLDIGVGLASSPFAILRGPIELRPDIGAYYVSANRLGCDRCSVNVTTPIAVEPRSGHTFRLRAGIDAYWGATKSNGIALDVLYQLGTLGDIATSADEPTSVELSPPRWLLRLSYVRRPLSSR